MNEPSFAHFHRRLYALVLASGLAVTAQAQVASPDLLRAQQAVQKAQAADADHYAPDLLDSAQHALIQAQAGALSRSRSERREADALARRAAADADLARVRSDRAQADAALLQRREEIAGLRQTLGLPQEGTP
jgi:hypothetical protein